MKNDIPTRGMIHDAFLLFCLIAAFSLSFPLFGQEPTAGETAQSDEADLPAPAVVAAAFPMAGVLLSFVPLFAPETAPLMQWIGNPLRIGAAVPLYWIDPGSAAGYTIAGLALPAAGVGFMFAGSSIPVSQPLSGTFLNGYSHLMEYAAYDTYRLSRKSRGGNSLPELAAAPFLPEHFLSPYVWIPSIVMPAALIGFYLVVEPGLGKPVYETGVSHIGTADVTPAVAGITTALFGSVDMLAVSIGEEAYYRGLIYDYEKKALGTLPARCIDMLFFPAIHLPNDIQTGLKTETIVFNYAWRSVMTLLFDVTYDEGGLPLAVATHFWSDFLLVMARWIFTGG